MAKKNAWPELGIITKNQAKDKDGNLMVDSKGQPIYKVGFKFADNVTILVDGQPFDGSRYGVLKTPVEEVESLYKAGQIEDAKIEARRQSAKEAYEWLRYKITIPPAQK